MTVFWTVLITAALVFPFGYVVGWIACELRGDR